MVWGPHEIARNIEDCIDRTGQATCIAYWVRASSWNLEKIGWSCNIMAPWHRHWFIMIHFPWIQDDSSKGKFGLLLSVGFVDRQGRIVFPWICSICSPLPTTKNMEGNASLTGGANIPLISDSGSARFLSFATCIHFKRWSFHCRRVFEPYQLPTQLDHSIQIICINLHQFAS